MTAEISGDSKLLSTQEREFLQAVLDPLPETGYLPGVNNSVLARKGLARVLSVIPSRQFVEFTDAYGKGGQSAVVLTALGYEISPPGKMNLYVSKFLSQDDVRFNGQEATLSLEDALEMKLSYISSGGKIVPKHFFLAGEAPEKQKLAYYKVVTYLSNIYIRDQMGRSDFSMDKLDALRKSTFDAVTVFLSVPEREFMNLPKNFNYAHEVIETIRRKDPLSLIRSDPGETLGVIFRNRFIQRREEEQQSYNFIDNRSSKKEREQGVVTQSDSADPDVDDQILEQDDLL